MMDAETLFPDGHHPIYPVIRADLKGYSRRYIRLEASTPVRYCFIDFGLSSHIPAGESNLVVGVDGLDEEVPELSSTIPYDAFKVDIFTVGNVFRRNIYDVSVFVYRQVTGTYEHSSTITESASYSPSFAI